MVEMLAIDLDEVLSTRWTGHDRIGDLDDNPDSEAHLIPPLIEVSDDEDGESELGSDDLWDDQDTEDLLDVLETNVELDACRSGMWYLGSPVTEFH